MIPVYKAQPTGDQIIANLNLTAVQTFPDITDPVDAAVTHEANARTVVNALLGSLPGGTVDSVLRLLLEHRASLLRVRWPGAAADEDLRAELAEDAARDEAAERGRE